VEERTDGQKEDRRKGLRIRFVVKVWGRKKKATNKVKKGGTVMGTQHEISPDVKT